MSELSTQIQVCETVMLVCFGLSWPFSVIKSLRSKTAKGKSIFFQLAIITGYIAGIIGKAIASNFTYIFWLYALNLAMVSLDLILYFRNAAIDRKMESDNKGLILDVDCVEEKTNNCNATEEGYEPGMLLAMSAMKKFRKDGPTENNKEEVGMSLAKAALRKI